MLLCSIAVCGCGGSNEPRGIALSGKVSYKGTPLTDGSISFIPVDGNGPTAGATIENGTFSVPAVGGPRPGKHRSTWVVSCWIVRRRNNDRRRQCATQPVRS